MPNPIRQIYNRSAQWQVIHLPAVNTVATVTRASAGAGRRNVLCGFTAALVAGAVAPAAVQVTLNVIDGASGGGTYLWRNNFAMTAVAGQMFVQHFPNLELAGSVATDMTIEFSAAGGANTFESITMWGYDTAD